MKLLVVLLAVAFATVIGVGMSMLHDNQAKPDVTLTITVPVDGS